MAGPLFAGAVAVAIVLVAVAVVVRREIAAQRKIDERRRQSLARPAPGGATPPDSKRAAGAGRNRA